MSSVLHKVIVKAWIEKDGKFLLAQRGSSEKHHAGVWSLPGGNVDAEVTNDIIENTLHREVREEVGVELEDVFDLVYTNGFIKESDSSHVINLTFLCKYKSGKARALEDTEAIAWHTPDELEDLENKPDFLAREIFYLTNFIERNKNV